MGMWRPRLGSARLKGVETVAALVRIGNADADLAVAEAGLIPRCLELFLLFPFNNLLHHQVPYGAARRPPASAWLSLGDPVQSRGPSAGLGREPILGVAGTQT